MRLTRLTLLVILSISTAVSQAEAGYIVNTGSPAAFFGGYTLSAGQYLAAEFAVGGAYLVNSVEGHLSHLSGAGGVEVSLHADGGATPGSVLHSFTISPSIGTVGWFGQSGLNWALAPGTYWVSFSTYGAYAGAMQFPAPNPLTMGYAVGSSIGPWNSTGNLNLGIRIDATEVEASPTPEPASMALLAMGGGLLAFGRKRLGRCRQPAERTA